MSNNKQKSSNRNMVISYLEIKTFTIALKKSVNKREIKQCLLKKKFKKLWKKDKNSYDFKICTVRKLKQDHNGFQLNINKNLKAQNKN